MKCSICTVPLNHRNVTGICQQNDECRRANKREWRKRYPPDKYRRSLERARETYSNGKRWTYILRTYGLTREDFEALLRSQGSVCAICGDVPQGKGRCGQWNVDHDHKTGAVRSLLCWSCNSMLGYAKDNPGILDAAAHYLRAHGKQVAT